ncbi:MAG: hypothetical protein NUV37_01185 [Nanoarchaeota archaeon]|nr:hypothetical protein [Nanoarchaeota archaeon]
MGVEGVIWYLFLIDSLFANAGAWFFPKWYKKKFRGLWKHLPLTRAWACVYLILIIWIGCALFRLGVLWS